MVFRIALITVLLALTGCGEPQQPVKSEWIGSVELVVNSLTSQIYGSDPNSLRQVVNRQGQAIILLITKYREVEEQVKLLEMDPIAGQVRWQKFGEDKFRLEGHDGTAWVVLLTD